MMDKIETMKALVLKAKTRSKDMSEAKKFGVSSPLHPNMGIKD
jgi:hypothetical protein